MLRSIFSGEDPVANATHKTAVAERQAAARAQDQGRARAARAAGADRRSIGTTRDPGQSRAS